MTKQIKITPDEQGKLFITMYGEKIEIVIEERKTKNKAEKTNTK